MTASVNICFVNTVTVEWYVEKEYWLAALSIGCICLGIAVQVLLVDKGWKRRLMSVSHVKLLVDGYASFTGGVLTQGYGTAKFTEAVYESLLEV